MNKHLAIQANGKMLALGDNFTLDIDYQNPMFNDADSFSYPAEIPLEGNRHLVHNIEEARSPMRPISLDGIKTRIYAEGLPVFDGKTESCDEEELTDKISLSIKGNSTLDDIISDLDCKDIPLIDPWDEKLNIGTKIEKATFLLHGADFGIAHTWPEPHAIENTSGFNDTVEVTPQALGFSIVNSNNVNVDKPYPEKLFCNSRIAYKHYALDAEGKTSESVQEGENGPYFVLDANRQQSGICFFVLYFLDCLFAHLGLQWDKTELMKIEDIRRLCFFSTKCEYSTAEPHTTITENGDGDNELDIADTRVNKWLKENNCGAEFKLDTEKDEDRDFIFVPAGGKISAVINDSSLSSIWDMRLVKYVAEEMYIRKTDDRTFNFSGWSFEHPETDEDWEWERRLNIAKTVLAEQLGKNKEDIVEGENITMRIDSIEHRTTFVDLKRCSFSLADMYANSNNFPEESVSTVLEALQNQFGIRFLYDAEQHTVKAALMREMYRSTKVPHKFHGTIHSMTKLSERTTGVRIGYSAEGDAKEQRTNLRDAVKDYDTSYDYIDYPVPGSNGQVGISVARNTIIDKKYADIYSTPSATDNTCYIDTNTGNAYRIKVDSEAESANSLAPAWFEVGQFHSAEFGDCSKANEDNIVEIMSGFTPLVLSDVRRKQNGRKESFLVPFVDEDMEHEYVEQALKYPCGNGLRNIANITAHLKLLENYDPTSSDNGNSPLQSVDWGLTIGIMRGSYGEGGIQSYDYNYDGFGNSKYRTVSSRYAVCADTMDHFGNEYDYNGEADGIGSGEQFSLKPRAVKTPSWAPEGVYTDTEGNQHTLCKADYYEGTEPNKYLHFVRGRGWVDRFWLEHVHFLLNRRKFLVKCECTAAMIINFQNHWQDRWNINGETGYVNKVSVSIDINSGIQEAEIEFYAL